MIQKIIAFISFEIKYVDKNLSKSVRQYDMINSFWIDFSTFLNA